MGSQPAQTHPAGPSHAPRTIRGTQPGLLDPTQSSRLLRAPDSRLSFASFDPRTALAGEDIPDLHKLSIGEDLPPPKRIVIETTPKGTSFWRFVPKARLDGGVRDEGFWPRVVEICGEHVFCYQEQWEIYKLDPEYQCTVHFGFRFSSVVRVDPQARRSRAPSPSGPKRVRARTPTPEADTPLPSKKARSRCAHVASDDYSSDSESDEDEEEVKQMVVDDLLRRRAKPTSDAVRSGREELKKGARRALAEEQESTSKICRCPWMQNNLHLTAILGLKQKRMPNEKNTDLPLTRTTKLPQEHTPTNGHVRKRQRTTSPSQAKQALYHSKVQREMRKQAKVRAMDERHQKGFKQVFADYYPINIDELLSHHKEPSTCPQPAASQERSDSRESDDSNEEAMRQAELAESIRKMRELDRDRPLWEEQRKKREAHERAEEQERQAKAEQRRRAEAERQRQQREEAERQARQVRAEAERRDAEERQRQEQRRFRQRQRQRWESGTWTSHRALERYKVLSEEFDTAKFTPDQPIAFLDIPWPVLHHPSRLTVEDVDWSAVERFFATVKTSMRPQDYKDFVERSHRRFHPDRWRARKLWSAIRDDVERSCLEVAANTVAQAITPIWREVKPH
ncbi:hypothetical protein DFJ58DRAFT_725404 [Suillus subalutaceus]|uniref:uncharacterized protein n=1 Tax=Suillus subalutaceus TaxID=48586 RepID=UPI001B86EA60|nr:uncharacterized protein DFJ58DRAFT_725404 [Suillus subalutaceus]KAG1862566.1 hypothetical protein DFJ58DRAFT_725404 [Suillus subalutaceus]